MKQLEWFVSGFVILALAVVGLLYAFSGPGPEVRKAAEQRSQVAEGIRLAIEQRGNMVVTNFVPGARFNASHWDFRAEADGEGRVEPVYGVARLVCDRVQALARCWQIVELERDGRKLISRADRDGSADTTASGSGSTSGSGAPAIRTTPSAVAEPAPATAAPAPAPSATAPTQAAPAPITEWQVTGAAVNGRAGPGTTFPVVVRLTPENRLRLIEADARWGHYEIVSPAADAGQRMWIWSDLVAEIK